MSTRTIATTPETALRPDPTARFRRVAAAAALPLGIALQVATNTIYSLVTLDGGSDTKGADALKLFAAHPDAAHLAVLLSLLGSMLIVAGMPAALRVLRTSRPRLSLVAGMLMTAGYIAYFGIVSTTGLQITLATMHVDAAAAIDASQDDIRSFVVMIVFVLGNILGTFLLGLAVLLSKQAHWLAGALIMAWPLCHITGLIVGTEWFAVAGASLETVGLVMVAAVAFRMSDAEWISRG